MEISGAGGKADNLYGKSGGQPFRGSDVEVAGRQRGQGKRGCVQASARGGAVPWLLVKVVGHTGEEKLSAAEYVTRTNTKGGVAPQSGCDAAHQGAAAPVPYSATYRFYGK
jgi:Protein of unknown function (DUF3455)